MSLDVSMITRVTKKFFYIARSFLRQFAWRANRRFRQSEVIKTKQGFFKLFYKYDDSISRSLYLNRSYHGEHIRRTIAFMESRKEYALGEGTFVDVGANNGIISIAVLLGGYFKHAIAIEPDPINFSILESNLKLNNLSKRVATINYAISSETGELSLEIDQNNLGDHRIRINSKQASPKELFGESERVVKKVDSETIDNVIKNLDKRFTKDIKFIWMDVQGHEGFVFKGGASLFSRDIPVLTEVWPYGILRSGQTLREYFSIVSSLWSHVWIWRRRDFIDYPIDYLPYLFKELGNQGDFDDIIFTK